MRLRSGSPWRCGGLGKDGAQKGAPDPLCGSPALHRPPPQFPGLPFTPGEGAEGGPAQMPANGVGGRGRPASAARGGRGGRDRVRSAEKVGQPPPAASAPLCSDPAPARSLRARLRPPGAPHSSVQRSCSLSRTPRAPVLRPHPRPSPPHQGPPAAAAAGLLRDSQGPRRTAPTGRGALGQPAGAAQPRPFTQRRGGAGPSPHRLTSCACHPPGPARGVAGRTLPVPAGPRGQAPGGPGRPPPCPGCEKQTQKNHKKLRWFIESRPARPRAPGHFFLL